MGRGEPATVARALVTSRFPNVVQAWLAGSVVLGQATSTSDLDVAVLLPHGEVHRESLVYDGWPVELFVHTETSLRHFVAKDLERRRPTMLRMVAAGIPLVPGSGGAAARAECQAALAAGPPSLLASELDAMRYALTDALDDLRGGASGAVGDAVVIEVWRLAAELGLATAGQWEGTGKWLMRELLALDERDGTDVAPRLHAALQQAMAGVPEPLAAVAEEVLDRAGGSLWSGYYRAAALPEGAAGELRRNGLESSRSSK